MFFMAAMRDEIRCGGGFRRRGGTYTLILIHLYTLEKECIGMVTGGRRLLKAPPRVSPAGADAEQQIVREEGQSISSYGVDRDRRSPNPETQAAHHACFCVSSSGVGHFLFASLILRSAFFVTRPGSDAGADHLGPIQVALRQPPLFPRLRRGERARDAGTVHRFHAHRHR